MNLQQLQYLHVLAQTENYTQAAEMLHITQPSLSYAISSLESQVNIKLFEKSGRNIKLTRSGKIFVEESLAAIESLNRAIERAKKSENNKEVIKISMLRSISSHWLPATIRKFLDDIPEEKQPSFEFESDIGFSHSILDELREEKIDVAFCSKIDNLDDVDYFPVYEQKLKFITPLDHPLANKNKINLKDTLDFKYITYSSNTGLRAETEQLFSICGGTPDSVFEVDEDETVAGMVAANFGVGIVPEMPILRTLDVKQIPIEFPKWHRFIYMATLKRHYQSPAALDFNNFIKQNSDAGK